MPITSYLEEYSRLRGCSVVANGRTVGRVHDLCMERRGWQVPFLWLDGDGLDLLESGSLLPGCRVRGIEGVELQTRDPRLLVARDGEQDVVWVSLRPGRELLGRELNGGGESVGCVVDLLVNTAHWVVRYWVVDRGADHVLVHTSHWDEGDPAGSILLTELPKVSIETAPAYTGIDGLSPGYLDCVYRHYTQRRFTHATHTAAYSKQPFGPNPGMPGMPYTAAHVGQRSSFHSERGT